ncbi:hypothetical protein CEXT_606351 [Caerostris extrusa]|uniref:Uncharacterized protein n=1 Tax=Caerostris extrusa TaxID=172846 RepID=A0AAV4RQ32_CAEEX|nr:hypothetical protein CEXT_606351 [Caerostris extrusa]
MINISDCDVRVNPSLPYPDPHPYSASRRRRAFNGLERPLVTVPEHHLAVKATATRNLGPGTRTYLETGQVHVAMLRLHKSIKRSSPASGRRLFSPNGCQLGIFFLLSFVVVPFSVNG